MCKDVKTKALKATVLFYSATQTAEIKDKHVVPVDILTLKKVSGNLLQNNEIKETHVEKTAKHRRSFV